MKDNKNAFDKETSYKLYRTIKEIIHPSISKKNISEYKIVIDDNLLSLRVFYPKKISTINKILLYVPGDGTLTNCNNKYSSICKDLALSLDTLIIAIDYYDVPNIYPNVLDKLETTIKYLYKELEKYEIENDKIILMGDSNGANFVSAITFRFINQNLQYIKKEILLCPLLSGEYFDKSRFLSVNKAKENNLEIIEKIRDYMNSYAKYKKNLKLVDVCPLLNKSYSNYSKTLIITGDLDPLRDEGEEFYKQLDDSVYVNITYANHGFLIDNNIDVRKKYLNSIKEFI